MAPKGLLPFLREADEGLGLGFVGSAADFAELPTPRLDLPMSRLHDTAYIQHTSGSTPAHRTPWMRGS